MNKIVEIVEIVQNHAKKDTTSKLRTDYKYYIETEKWEQISENQKNR